MGGAAVNTKRNRGFTLLEMALVMVVMALLLSGLMRPLLNNREQLMQRRDALLLADAREALLGFAARQGRLPCPATATSGGAEVIAAAGCVSYGGYIPVVQLGLSGPLDAQGRLLNPWSVPLRYSLSNADTDVDGVADFAVSGAMRDVGLAQLQGTLKVHHWPGGDCDQLQLRASHVVALLYSPGKVQHTSDAETLNRAMGSEYATGAYSQSQACGFDDRLSWVSDSALFSLMLRARQLP